MAFDAGSVDARLTLDPSAFDRGLDKAEERVKKFERGPHRVKLTAAFDSGELTRARKQFADLDNAISKDAMSRLRSSPQGSVLGALNALFSPHPVSGAPTPAQAASQGLLGRMVTAPGGGGRASGSVIDNRVNGVNDITRVLGAQPGNVTTTDTIRQNVIGAGPGNTSTTDTIREKLDPKSTGGVEKAAEDSGGRAGGRWSLGFGAHLGPFFAGFRKQLGDAGSSGGAAMGKGLLSGIGPGILGVGVKMSGIVGLAGSALGAVPALAGVAGVGIGVALIGGITAKMAAGNAQIKGAFQGLFGGTNAAGKQVTGSLSGIFDKAFAPMVPAITGVLKQVTGVARAMIPALTSIFKTIAPQIQGIFNGLRPVITGLLGVMQAAAPAFGPFVNAITGLVASILPGLQTVIKATVPFISQFAGILGSLGASLGGLFAAAAPAIGASMKILSGLLGLIGDLLPVVMKLADIFAVTLAPVFTAFAGVVQSLLKPLTLIGGVIAQFAGAVIGDLASAFGAVATLIQDLGPSLTILAKALGGVFALLENSGVFAVFGDALENVVGPLSKLVNTLVTGLAPAFPVLIGAAGTLAAVLIGALSSALGAILTAVTPVVSALATATASVVSWLQSTGLLIPVLAGLAIAFGPVSRGLVAMGTGLAAMSSGAAVTWIAGLAGGIRDFMIATEGATIAEKALFASELALDAISPLGWAVLAGVAIAGLVIGIRALASGSQDLEQILAGQDKATGFNIAGYQKLAAQLTAVAGGYANVAAAQAQNVKGAGGSALDLSKQLSAQAQAAAQMAQNLQDRLAGLSRGLGVSQTTIEQWASAAGISAAKFGSAGENVGTLTSSIVDFVNKNPQAVLAVSSLATKLAIFGDDVFGVTTQLDAFNSIWNTLVGNLLTKQEAITNSKSQFDALTQTIKSGGAQSDQAKQSFQQYIAQIGSSASTLIQQGSSIGTVNGYLQSQIDNIKTLGPLNAGEKADLAGLKLFQDALANSTNGLNGQQRTLISQFENGLIPDLRALHADTPKVTGDIGNLANSIIQTGNKSASTAGDRAQLIRDLESAGVQASVAKQYVDRLQGSIAGLRGKVVNVGVNADATGGVSITGPGTSTHISFAPYFDVPGKAAGGLLAGYGGGDSVLALLEPGEAVVDKVTTRQYAPALKAMGVPGFAAGGIAGWEGAAANALGADAESALAGDVRAAVKAIGAAAAGTRVNYHPAAGVTQWEGVVAQALNMEGLAASLMQNVMIQIQSESGGNPNAINLTDSNAAAGDPSRGLLQTIMTTFLAYHWPGTSGNIYDPLANIAAALNYARHVYGPTLMSGGMGIGSGHGYSAGGPITEPIIGYGVSSGRRYTFGENGEEYVTPGGSPPSSGGGPSRLADTISIMLPEGSTVAHALSELTWFLQASKMQAAVP